MISINMKPDDIERVRSMLSEVKKAPDRVISRSINKTLAGVKTDSSTAVRGIITAKKTAVDKTFKTSLATATKLSGAFQSTGKPLPLIDYAARQTKAGVSVQVKKLNPRKVIPGAFITTVRSEQQAEAGSAGHKGVFWRVYRGDKKPVKKTAYAKLPRKYRLPIDQKYGPRIPDILSNEPVMAGVLKKADERLHINMERELNFELSKL